MGTSYSKPRTSSLGSPPPGLFGSAYLRSTVGLFGFLPAYAGSAKALCEEAPPPPPPLPDASKEALPEVSPYANPGPYEMVAQDSKRLVMLDVYDGFRCDISKQLSPYMAVVHNFLLGTTMLPDGRNKTYAFVTQVADETGMLLMTRVDPSRGSVDGRFHRALLGGLALGKVHFGVNKEGQMEQCLAEMDVGAQTWTANVKYGSMGGGLLYSCNFLQAITPRLAMGGEGMYLAANQRLMSNYTVRYTMPARTGDEDSDLLKVPASGPQTPPGAAPSESTGSSTFIANYNADQGVTVNYRRVVTPNRVTLGAELQCNPITLDSAVLLGAEFKLNRSKLQFCVDGDLKIQSVLEAKMGMQPGAPTLSFAAEVDHLKDAMKFGFGLNLES